MPETKKLIFTKVAIDRATTLTCSWCDEVISSLTSPIKDKVEELSNTSVTIQNILRNKCNNDDGANLLIFYGHGTPNEGYLLDYNRVEFLNCNTIHHFDNFIFYCACCSTLKMGEKSLKRNGIHAVIGYDGSFDLNIRNDYFFKCFENCLNSGIIFIIAKRKTTLDEVYHYMEEIFNREIEFAEKHIESDKDALMITLMLQTNLKRLGYLGGKDFKIQV